MKLYFVKSNVEDNYILAKTKYGMKEEHDTSDENTYWGVDLQKECDPKDLCKELRENIYPLYTDEEFRYRADCEFQTITDWRKEQEKIKPELRSYAYLIGEYPCKNN